MILSYINERLVRRVDYQETRDGQVATHFRFVYDNFLCVQRLDAANDNAVRTEFVWDPTEPIATRPLVFQPASGETAYYFHAPRSSTTLSEMGSPPTTTTPPSAPSPAPPRPPPSPATSFPKIPSASPRKSMTTLSGSSTTTTATTTPRTDGGSEGIPLKNMMDIYSFIMNRCRASIYVALSGVA